jgi:hypothetical protein
MHIRMRSMVPGVAASVALAVLAGCAKQVAAPMTAGICWQAIPLTNGQVRFNKVSSGEPTIEACAASLEGMRLRFLSIGGSRLEITGAYQGNFLFLNEQGIFTAEQLNGPRYFLLGRAADGSLATASALSTGQ